MCRRRHASPEEIIASSLQQRRKQNCRDRNAPQKARDTSFRKGRQRWQGKEPQAGDRDRSCGSAQEGSKSAKQEIQLSESSLAPLGGRRRGFLEDLRVYF